MPNIMALFHYSSLVAAGTQTQSVIWQGNRGFPGGSAVKHLPADAGDKETRVQSLGREDPLEKVMATHSSILAWRNLMDRGAWWAAVHGVADNQT